MLPFGHLADIGREGASAEQRREVAVPPSQGTRSKARGRRRREEDPGVMIPEVGPDLAPSTQASLAPPLPAQVSLAEIDSGEDAAGSAARVAAAAVAAPARKRAREIADRRLHVMITATEMEYLREVARRKAGDLGRVFGDSASIGQVVRYLIHFHEQSEGGT